MIAVDTNILIYAHRRDSAWHADARGAIRGLSDTLAEWAIPWPCLHEFIGVSTHPSVYSPASTLVEALTQIDIWLRSPTLSLLAETAKHLPILREIASAGRIVGPAIYDARIAAICLQHGVSELWSADRDFSRFPSLKVRNPLI